MTNKVGKDTHQKDGNGKEVQVTAALQNQRGDKVLHEIILRSLGYKKNDIIPRLRLEKWATRSCLMLKKWTNCSLCYKRYLICDLCNLEHSFLFWQLFVRMKREDLELKQ